MCKGGVKGMAGWLEHGICGGKGRTQIMKRGLRLCHNGLCVLSDGVWGFIL